MVTIENQQLRLTIHPKGAELQSIFQKEFQTEYMWSGDPAFWGKHSPLLFPIVGTLKGNTYNYQGNAYSLPRHGFARDHEFAVETQSAESIGFLLKSDAATKKNYPFGFELRVIYRLNGSGFSTTYRVTNPATGPLYFSVGGHPAFKVPLAPGTEYTDYYLEFDQTENTPRWPISKDGLIDMPAQPLLNNTRTLPLTKDLFAKDALVLKHPASSGVALRSKKTERGLKMDYPGFPFLGIWAAPKADFVCLEPWCGIADAVDSSQELTEKEGIQRLESGETFGRSWTLTLF
ncbi:MAG TPA: aldose 1-epimerase family protein [Puia sp.]|uniref:aldose 1-epimerase family protein n=1 Tax=Puia sp. TaxID=2045100 RepID=UPI002B926B69|nr:aldose 1-epimerase family protein [Puia sp.]HVU96499.1 aldose 1-epimerase family protein [Puia sp.]